ncbi:hypothetical protein C6H88_01595 [Chlamydia muridarum str. Nigg]|jgi:hypothetical protein|uniref:Membrane protein n=2 Tax=Chlamydia muridarum TaxID=83560 RepID=A0A069ZUZ6_CHLMR|nr:hypothetical protein [Chlamydia muridarum]UFW31933.1 hypothetical protein FTM92_01700 [Chlamydia trachomatis]AAF39173.1 conserved hypothetical protein [Chlamydia muridarum str. Nigg]AHH22698.1 hypothetical protein TAC_01610 [Chlamydia muridarum str. Nigg3 CMUT3-5]AHH23622.1 hypothetical protein Y015_01610 [Chlamydia muridarum str. Nigg CM972]AID37841.1 membrane protein [Chlamydia muridarum str. Nigg 2 MCR]
MVSKKQTSWFGYVEEIVIRSWWLILYLLGGGFVYDRAISQLHVQELRLQQRVFHLKSRLEEALDKQQEFSTHLASWDNPQVIELALIHKLGLVPKGYEKICFQDPPKTKKNPRK